jgi:cytochrome c biogenesis protein CcdA
VLFSLLALAVVDSVNPSAIAVTLYLLSRERAAAPVAVYIAAIFLTYLALGALMIAGLDALLPALRDVAGGRVGFIVQGVVGLAMVLYALRAPAPATASTAPADRGAATLAAVALLGVTVTAMELPTAVPYLGAVALLTSSGLPVAQWFPLLVVYNVIFVLPPVLLLAGHLALGARLEARYAALRVRLQAGAHETMLWIFGLVGGALLVTSVIEYVARYVVR